MTMPHLGTVATSLQQATGASLMGWIARGTMLRRKMLAGEVYGWLESAGCPERAQRILKSSVGAASTIDSGWAGAAAGDYKLAVAAFAEALKTRSIFFHLIENGMVRIPLQRRIGVTTAAATGWIVGEGKPVPLTKLQLRNQLLEPVRAAALMVMTEELVRDVSAVGQTLFVQELRAAVSSVVDSRFFEIIGSITTDQTIASAGNDEDAIKLDLRAALMAVATGSNSRLAWAMSPDVAKAASVFVELCPQMSAEGGTMVNLPALVTNALEAGTLALIDAAGIAGNVDNIDLRASDQVDVEMSDSPTQDATAGTAPASSVSMFQTDALALMATTSFGAEVLRDNAVAMVVGVDWGG